MKKPRDPKKDCRHVIRGHKLELAMTCDELLLYAHCRPARDKLIREVLFRSSGKGEAYERAMCLLRFYTSTKSELERRARERLDNGFKPFARPKRISAK